MNFNFAVTPKDAKDLLFHVIAIILAGAAAYPAGRYIGFQNGLKQGQAIATEVATNISSEAAIKTRDLVTAEFIKQEVERAYKTELDAREQVGIEKGRQSGGYSCALEDYYRIIRGYIAQGGAAKSSDDVVIIARNIVRIKDIGSESLGEIGGKVLNGQIDELAGALRRGDTKGIGQLLKELNATLEARDRSFRHAKETLISAK